MAGKATSAEFARETMGTHAVDQCATVAGVLGAKGCAESQTNRNAYGLIIEA
jgi:hypothetical protein